MHKELNTNLMNNPFLQLSIKMAEATSGWASLWSESSPFPLHAHPPQGYIPGFLSMQIISRGMYVSIYRLNHNRIIGKYKHKRQCNVHQAANKARWHMCN
jgi:hypothetical protein